MIEGCGNPCYIGKLWLHLPEETAEPPFLLDFLRRPDLRSRSPAEGKGSENVENQCFRAFLLKVERIYDKLKTNRCSHKDEYYVNVLRMEGVLCMSLKQKNIRDLKK